MIPKARYTVHVALLQRYVIVVVMMRSFSTHLAKVHAHLMLKAWATGNICCDSHLHKMKALDHPPYPESVVMCIMFGDYQP